jgi:hypothetical protein
MQVKYSAEVALPQSAFVTIFNIEGTGPQNHWWIALSCPRNRQIAAPSEWKLG